jgi:hypothetical protein
VGRLRMAPHGRLATKQIEPIVRHPRREQVGFSDKLLVLVQKILHSPHKGRVIFSANVVPRVGN